MESEIKIIIKKKDGNYKTPSYVRNAVKNYETRMKKLSPEKYNLRLEKQKEYYQKRKERLALEKEANENKLFM